MYYFSIGVVCGAYMSQNFKIPNIENEIKTIICRIEQSRR